jgi:hypothetical protein
LLRYRLGFALAAALLGAGCFSDPVNMSPTVRIDKLTTPILRGESAMFQAVPSDPDGDGLRVEMTNTPDLCGDVPPSDQFQPVSTLSVPARDKFCVWARVTDTYQAVTIANLNVVSQDRPPLAALDFDPPSSAVSFPVKTLLVLSAMGSSDPDIGDTLHFDWALTPKAPMADFQFGPCADKNSDAFRCLTAKTTGAYDVVVTVSDDAGLKTTAAKEILVLPGTLPTAVIDLVGPTGIGPFPLGSTFRVSGARSIVGDGSTLSYAWTLTGPPITMGPTGPRPTVLPTMKCDGDDTQQSQCFVADMSGSYSPTLTVTNASGDSQPVTAGPFTVAPDQPPCLDQTTPPLTASMTTSTSFSVGSVSDDLDPFPGVENMQWFQSTGYTVNGVFQGGPFVPMTKDFSMFNVTGATFGQTVRVRLEIHDRNVDRTATEFQACGDADVCAVPSLIHPDTCIQRMTWTVQILQMPMPTP